MQWPSPIYLKFLGRLPLTSNYINKNVVKYNFILNLSSSISTQSHKLIFKCFVNMELANENSYYQNAKLKEIN